MTICSCTDKPRLLGHPLDLEHTKPVAHLVSTQDLERHNERVRHEIVIHARMENLDRAIVAARREERVRRVEVHRTQRTRVVPVMSR